MLKIINSHNQVLHVADMAAVYEYLEIVALDCVNRNATEYEPTMSVRVFKGEEEVLDGVLEVIHFEERSACGHISSY